MEMRQTQKEWLNIKTLREMLEDYESRIDHYTDYIDNYRQYKEAQRRNNYYYSLIEFTGLIIKEYEDIIEKLRNKPYFSSLERLEYSKGYWRLLYKNKWYYKKTNVKYNPR